MGMQSFRGAGGSGVIVVPAYVPATGQTYEGAAIRWLEPQSNPLPALAPARWLERARERWLERLDRRWLSLPRG